MIPIAVHYANFKKLDPDNDDADKEGYVSISSLTGLPVNVQPASPNPSEIATGVFDKKHVLFMPITASGVREGYRITISGLYDGEYDRDFNVEGVEDWSKGPLPHYEATISELIN